jgi:hypothetical protein
MSKTTSLNLTSYQTFKNYLADNMKYETSSQLKICKLNNTNIIEISNDNRYDFRTSDNLTYEVKADHLAIKTNYFFIEYFCRKKLSGLSVSKSDYYILTDTKYYFLISTEKLKKLTENASEKMTKDKTTVGYMINRFEIIQNSTVLK